MARIAKRYKSKLEFIKQRVEAATIYFKENNFRFHDCTKFVFKTAINAADESNLKAYGKPIIEFNFVNAFISRLCGEFSKQVPSITVMAENGMPVDENVIRVVEGHIRHVLFEANKLNTQYNIYKDQLAGGFSDYVVFTEYAHEMSMDQVIRVKRAYEPTMVGYDPNAREDTKCDAEYCFELFPIPKDQFETDYPDIDISNLQFTRSTLGFDWTFETAQNEVVVVCDYYEKKRIKFEIVKLANNRVMKLKDYEQFVQEWLSEGFTEQPPAIVGEPRWTSQTVICRYRIIGTEVIEYKETDFKYLPLVFVDGDSVILKEGTGSTFSQFTKPYIYHARGIQRLTNFAGQVIGNDFENMVMHKFKVAKESIPQEEEYQEAYKNVQQASTLVYNAFMDGDPDKPVPAPQEVARVGLPSEVVNTFNTAIQMTQNILGSYDAALGINDNQLSGTAIVEAATQSNAAAMPYVVSHMQALNHVANIILDLIPKYYVTPRTIPIIDREGNRTYQKINMKDQDSIDFNYDSNVLTVRVEAAPSFAIQKSRALNQIALLAQTSPLFAQFMAEEGLDFILDNMEFRGSDILAERAKAWMEQLKQKQAQAAQQPNPIMLQEMNEKQRLQQDAMKIQQDGVLKAQEISVNKQRADNERMDILLKAGANQNQLMVDVAKAKVEENRTDAELQIKHADMVGKHIHNAEVLKHEKEKAKNEARNNQSSE